MLHNSDWANVPDKYNISDTIVHDPFDVFGIERTSSLLVLRG